jgi:hypothetical protein
MRIACSEKSERLSDPISRSPSSGAVNWTDMGRFFGMTSSFGESQEDYRAGCVSGNAGSHLGDDRLPEGSGIVIAMLVALVFWGGVAVWLWTSDEAAPAVEVCHADR